MTLSHLPDDHVVYGSSCTHAAPVVYWPRTPTLEHIMHPRTTTTQARLAESRDRRGASVPLSGCTLDAVRRVFSCLYVSQKPNMSHAHRRSPATGGPMKPINRIYVHLSTNDPSRCTCSKPVDSGRRYLGHYACVLCGLLIERLIGC